MPQVDSGGSLLRNLNVVGRGDGPPNAKGALSDALVDGLLHVANLSRRLPRVFDAGVPEQ